MRIHELAAQRARRRSAITASSRRWASPRQQLPSWDAIQFVTAQLARLPLLDDVPVGTEVCIGPNAAKPLWLDIPLFVSDMSFGALSQEAKTALARGAQLAGTGICSGEGGMLPEEQAENSRYFYELASARFGWSWDVLTKVQAFHFKLGQGAKTGTGGHLPGPKVMGRIAEVRGLPEGTPAVSPPTFPDWNGVDDFRRFADEVRERSGGIPIGAKLSAQHIESRHRRRARDRRRLHHPRRPRRRHRRGAVAVPRQHLGADDPRARARPPPPRPARPARRHARSSPAASATRPTSPRRSRSAPTRSRSPTARSRRSAASACARATRTTARSASRRRRNTSARACRSTKPSHRLERLPPRDDRAHAGARPRVRSRPSLALLRSTISPRSTATWPRSPASSTEACGDRRRSALVWHKVAELDELADGRVDDRDRGPHVARAHPLRRPRTARSTITARTRAVRSARDRSRRAGCGARGTATTTTRSPGTPPPGFTDAPASYPGRGARRRRLRRRCRPSTTARRTVSDVMVETMCAWGVTHVFGMVGHSNLGFADAMRVAETARRPHVHRHPPRGRGRVRGERVRQADRTARGVLRDRGTGFDQPAHRSVRRQGRPRAGARDLAARCRRRCAAAARSRIST